MLIITRKKAERIIISDDIEIIVLDAKRNRVRLGITAPKEVVINTKDKQPDWDRYPEVKELFGD